MTFEGLDDAERRMMAAFAQGGREAMDDLKSTSQDFVPYDQGDLSRSAKVSQDVTPAGWEGAVSYDTPYAAVQHEDRDLKHQDGKVAGYLGDPLRANAERYHAHVAETARRAME